MDHRSVVIRLAAEVRQILLATTVEVERRWQWLSLEERVSAVTDLLTSIRDFVRGFVDDAVMADAPTLSMDSQVADAVAPQDALALASAAAKSDSATTTDAAAIAFTALVQELVSSADALSFAAIKAVAETAVATDAPAKAFTATFLEVGSIYSAVDYFADDYVEAGTGPAVYDTFSYTLA